MRTNLVLKIAWVQIHVKYHEWLGNRHQDAKLFGDSLFHKLFVSQILSLFVDYFRLGIRNLVISELVLGDCAKYLNKEEDEENDDGCKNKFQSMCLIISSLARE